MFGIEKMVSFSEARAEGGHNMLSHALVDDRTLMIVAGVGVMAALIYYGKNIHPNLADPQKHAVEGMAVALMLVPEFVKAYSNFKSIGAPEIEEA